MVSCGGERESKIIQNKYYFRTAPINGVTEGIIIIIIRVASIVVKKDVYKRQDRNSRPAKIILSAT